MVETKQVAFSEIRPNPDNPRSITKAGLDRLAKSLKDFPEMLEIREVVVDETMTVLGGNMRLRALEHAGAKQCLAKIVTGLTAEQKREFVIKDNGSFGDWDFDALANAWDDLPLADWGVNLPPAWAGEGDGQEGPPSEDDKYRAQYGVIVTCEDESHQEKVYNILKEQGYNCKVVCV